MLLPFWGSTACQTTTYHYPAPASTRVPLSPPARLVFPTFPLRSLPDSSRQVVLVRTQVVAGSAKPTRSHPPGTTYVRVTQLDAQQRTLLGQVLAHPLQREVEYLTPAGALTRRLVVVPEADFFVRMPLHAATTALRVEESRAGQPGVVATFPFSAP